MYTLQYEKHVCFKYNVQLLERKIWLKNSYKSKKKNRTFFALDTMY